MMKDLEKLRTDNKRNTNDLITSDFGVSDGRLSIIDRLTRVGRLKKLFA
jgi:hypothetical protein